MTTNAEILDLAMSRLGSRRSTTVRANVLAELNAAIKNFERGMFHPWFLETTATLNIVVNDTFVALPSNFAREAEEARPYYVLEGTVYYLTKRFYGALVGEAPTRLKYYAIRGEEFHFRKVADTSYTILLPYYLKTDGGVVDDGNDISNVWLIDAQDWVIYAALRTVASVHLKDNELASSLSTLETKARNDLYNFHIARQAENQDFEVGGASDGT